MTNDDNQDGAKLAAVALAGSSAPSQLTHAGREVPSYAEIDAAVQAVWDAAWALHDVAPDGQQWKRSKALNDAIAALRLLESGPHVDSHLSAAAPELLEALKETLEACSAAMRVIAGIDVCKRLGIDTYDDHQRFAKELKVVGVKDGFGVRAQQAIAKAEAR